MSVNKPHLYDSGLHFITFTNYKWLPLIAITDGYQLVYKWFDHLCGKGHCICGYVIMPNHVHLLIAFNGLVKTYVMAIPFYKNTIVSDLVGNGLLFGLYYLLQRALQPSTQRA